MDLVRRFSGCFKTNEELPKNNRFEIAAEDYTIQGLCSVQLTWVCKRCFCDDMSKCKR